MNHSQKLIDTALQTYTVDPAHSRIGFVARHLGFSKVRGSFPSFKGTIDMEPGNLETLEASATIQTASVTTNDEKRDEHLRSPDFFDAAKHPELMFRSTSVRTDSGDHGVLVGDLTIRGVTKSVELAVVYLGESPDPWGGTRIGIEAEGKINRKDFGLKWNVALEAGGFVVSDEIRLVLDIQAVEQADDQA